MATYTPPRTPGTPRQAPGRARDIPPSRGAPPSRAPRRAAARHPAGPCPRRPGRCPPGAPPGRAPRIPGPARSAPRATPGRSPAPEPSRPPSRPSGRQLARTRPRHPRAPFILLLVGLLGGALVSLLVISTTLAQGSYRITSLQQQNANLAKQEQLLTQQVAQASSPATIAQEAELFGMRPNPALQFINLKTGKVVKGQVSKADAEINVPGYNP